MMAWEGHKAQETENHAIKTNFAKQMSWNQEFFQCKVSNTGQMGRYDKYHNTFKHQWSKLEVIDCLMHWRDGKRW